MFTVIVTDNNRNCWKSWATSYPTYEEALEYAEAEFAYGRNVSTPKEIWCSGSIKERRII